MRPPVEGPLRISFRLEPGIGGECVHYCSCPAALGRLPHDRVAGRRLQLFAGAGFLSTWIFVGYAFRVGDLLVHSTVDSVDTAAGRLGLVLLLGGAEPGSYGIGKDATDGVLPTIPPAPSSG